ncbi:MAG: hypothetical protein ACREHC_02305 [Candidatus Levyibacteriota bacterium]
MIKHQMKLLVLLPFFGLLLFATPQKAHAFSFGELFHQIKTFFSPEQSIVALNTSMELVSNSDLNKNGKIDSGDTVRFIYHITNASKNSFKFATLKTNIPSQELNSISNLKGATSIVQNKNEISFTHLNIPSSQLRTISFDAKVDYFTKQDQKISTKPVLVDNKNQTIASAQEIETSVAKMDSKQFNKYVHISK